LASASVFSFVVSRAASARPRCLKASASVLSFVESRAASASVRCR
jgi:hypothetical protein